jgi:small subunit ribosomal protein S6
MAQKKKIYETTFIVNANLDDMQIDAVIDKAKDLLVKNGGEILELAKWGRKRFAYPIKKKNNGFYVVIEFESSGDLVARLERHFLLDENIIRFLIIALNKNAIKGRISGNDLLKQAAPPPVSTAGPASPGTVPEEELEVPFPPVQRES